MQMRPLFWTLSALVLGIVLAPWLPFPVLVWYLGAALCGVVGVATRRVVFLYALAFLLGVGRARDVLVVPETDITHRVGERCWVRGMIVTPVEEGRNGTLLYTLAVQEPGSTGRLFVAQKQGADTPLYGDTVSVRGEIEHPAPATNPGQFDWRAYLARHGVYATLFACSPYDVRREAVSAAPLPRLAAFLRAQILASTAHFLNPADAALMQGLLLSTRTEMTASEQDAFQRTGTVHVLSVSGLHLAALAWGMHWLLRLRLRLPAGMVALLTVPTLWLYALASGGGPAVERSALMSTLLLVAPLVHRRAEPLHSLATAALVVLLYEPLALYDPGTQLTFATVGILALWLPPLQRLYLPWESYAPWHIRVRHHLLLSLLTGIIAQVGSAPLVAYHFNIFSTVAPLANLPIAPLSSALLIAGLVCVPLTHVPYLGAALWGIVGWGVELLRGLTFALSALPGAAFSVAAPPTALLLLWYTMLIALVVPLRRKALTPRYFVPGFVDDERVSL